MPFGDIEVLQEKVRVLEAQVRLFEEKLKAVERKLVDGTSWYAEMEKGGFRQVFEDEVKGDAVQGREEEGKG